MSRPDVLVVGGGPAGSAAAAWLAEAGVRVLLVERQAKAHHKVCGEFVSIGARRRLEELGLDLAWLGAAPIERVRLACRGDQAEAALPFAADSLSRLTLDEALLQAASGRGVEIRRGLSVRSGSIHGGGVRLELSDGSALEGGALLLATGKHDLPGFPRRRGIQNDLIGFKMHLEVPPPVFADLAGCVDLSFFDGGYAGLQPIEGGRANLCLVVRKARYQAVDRSWPRLLRYLGETSSAWRGWLADARPCWDRPLSIYGVPYGYVAGPPAGPVFRVGDQMAVIPSFAGEGIAIALGTARSAADAFLTEGAASGPYHRRAARSLSVGVRVSAVASRALQRPVLQSLAARAVARRPDLLALGAAATRLAG